LLVILRPLTIGWEISRSLACGRRGSRTASGLRPLRWCGSLWRAALSRRQAGPAVGTNCVPHDRRT